MSWYIDIVPQWTYIVLAGFSFAGFIAAMAIGMKRDFPKSVTVLMVAASLLTIYSGAVAATDNYRELTSGRVIATGYEPSASVVTCGASGVCSTTTSGGYWWLQVRDEEGRTGRIHFETDPSAEHPVGSHYDG